MKEEEWNNEALGMCTVGEGGRLFAQQHAL